MVFDMLGRRVTQLFKGSMGANETRAFARNGSPWSAGVYLYREQGENFSATGRMMLINSFGLSVLFFLYCSIRSP